MEFTMRKAKPESTADAPAPSRRSLLASASEIPTSAQPADPALEAVRNCQSALQAFKAALAESENPDSTKDRYVLSARANKASGMSMNAWRALFEVTPTTVAGAAALATYMLKYNREEGGADTAEEALEGLAGGLHRFAAAIEQGGHYV
jgi:hypothetical protein